MLRRRSIPAGHGWLLLLERDGWRILHDELSEKCEIAPESLQDQGPSLWDALRAAGWRGEPVVVGLSADMCLAATVPVPSPALLRKRQAMRFHLEEWIPWSAEDYVVDFVPHRSEALMIAAPIEPLRSLLLSLEEAGVTLAAIAPLALLALQSLLTRSDVPDDCVVMWHHHEGIELYQVRSRKAASWQHAPDQGELLAAGFRLQASDATPWFCVECPSPLLAALRNQGFDVAEFSDASWQAAWTKTASAVAAGAAEPAIDLRRDELAGRRTPDALAEPMRRLQAAVALLAVAVCVVLGMRGAQLQRAARESRPTLVELFERRFPDKPAPDDIAAALRGEHAALQRARGDVKELPDQASSDFVLDQTLAALPADLRFRVPEVRVEGASVHLAGEVRTNSDADQVAGSLRNAGFEVEPPHTQRMNGEGFSVHWTARWPTSAQNRK